MKNILIFIIILLMFCMFPITAFTQDTTSIVPKLINYQGFLTDSNGSALTGTYQITFRLYEEPTGVASIKWEEIHNSVNVVDGLFNVMLGSINPITPNHFGGQRYLEIKVGNEVEMTPRLQIGSSAYSLFAKNVFWRPPGCFYLPNVTNTYQAGYISISASNDQYINASSLVAERNIIITGCQIGNDDDTNGDTYTCILTKNGAIIGSEFSVTVTTNHVLEYMDLSDPVSFQKGERIGINVKSEGGGEEVFILLHGYCTN